MIKVIGGILADKIKNAFGEYLKKRYDCFKEDHEYRKFIKALYEWSNAFILDHETTVIAQSAFADYLKYYNLIHNIVDFICVPRCMTEDEFISQCEINAIDYLKSKKPLTPNDTRSVKEFIEGIMCLVKKYYADKVPADHIYLMHQQSEGNAILHGLDNRTKRIEQAIIPAKPKSQKKVYALPPNMIMRKFAPYKDVQSGVFFSNSSEDMLSVCLKEKHIVLLGDAGCGKSVALGQLAAMVCDTEYYPLRYDLNKYTDQTIDQIIYDSYENLDEAKLFLIIDAYDEIEPHNSNRFARELISYVEKNPDVIVIISSRNNFYQFARDDGSGGKFDQFKEYGIAPITGEDIKQYCIDQNINSTDFYKEIYTNELSELVSNPFYLNELILIFRRDQTLPLRPNLMDEIIKGRFDRDSDKYVNTAELAEWEAEIFDALEQLAFAIQCLHLVKISTKQYHELCADEIMRKRIQYSGMFSKDSGSNWSFEHNNFREYLAAKYLNRLSIAEIQQIVCSNEEIVYNSWLNVLSFLVLIRANDDLSTFLAEKNTELLVRFENSRFTEAERVDIVIKIMESYATRNMWISHGVNNTRSIAVFGESRKFCEFLLKEIENPVNFRAQNNALSVLAEMKKIFGLSERIQTVLFQCLQSDEVRDYEKAKVMYTLVALELTSKDITTYIIARFYETSDSYYRRGTLYYLHHSNQYEEYIDIYINAFKQYEKYSEWSINVRLETQEVFSKVTEYSALCKILTTLAEVHVVRSVDKSYYKLIFDNAVESYNQGNCGIFDVIFDNLIETYIHNNDFFEYSIQFLKRTNTTGIAFEKLLEIDLEVKTYRTIWIILSVGDTECYTSLIEKYHAFPPIYENIVKALAQSFDVSHPMFSPFTEALAINGIVLPERKPVFDMARTRNSGYSHYFMCLFDKEQYCSLVRKLLLMLGDEMMTFSQLKEKDCPSVNYDDTSNNTEEFTLLTLYNRLTSGGNDEHNVLRVIESISDWDQFIIEEGDYILQHDADITVSDEQRAFIFKYCYENLKEIDFQKDIHDDGPGSMSYTYHAGRLIFLSEYFDFQYETEIYRKMLFVPPHMFKSHDTSGQDKVPPYLQSHMTKADCESQIKHNLLEETMCAATVRMHIQYCIDHEYDWGIMRAETICSEETSDSWDKRLCIEYLVKINGYEYVYDRFLKSNDKDIIQAIIYVTQNKKDYRLKERLEQLNRESEDPHTYLTTLIFLNSRYGLHKYYEIAKSTMKAADNLDESICDPTLDVIAVINDQRLLDDLENIRKLLFTEGFEDKKGIGLYSSLYKAYCNIADTDYEAVKHHLDEALTSAETVGEEKSFCNNILVEIASVHNNRGDQAWDMKEIKTFIKAHKD